MYCKAAGQRVCGVGSCTRIYKRWVRLKPGMVPNQVSGSKPGVFLSSKPGGSVPNQVFYSAPTEFREDFALSGVPWFYHRCS